MKRQRGSAKKADRPIVAVSEVQIVAVSEVQIDGEDWYTPKVLKLAPLEVSVTLGKKGEGRVRCVIGDAEWERSCVELKIIFEDARASDAHFSLGWHSDIDNEFGKGTAGNFTRDQVDQLIRALTAARQEAEIRGLFTQRPTPTTVEQVLAAGGGR